VVILGTILPVIGSFLLLLSFVSASGVKVRRHPEAEDEAALGIGIYGYIGLCMAYALANASVWEEIVSRVLLLGIPLLAIDYLFRECGLALFSAIMFGLAHVGGWDFYKLIPSTVAGLFLAYMFMKHGLYASIMLHFAVDFYDMPLQMLDRSYSGLIPVVFVLFGFLAFIVYAKALFRFIGHDLMRLGSKKEGVGG